MNFDDKCVLQSYRKIASLSEEHNVFLVQHVISGSIYVKKTLTVYSKNVYENLKNNPVEGIPQIIEVIQDDGKLIIIEEYINGRTLRTMMDEGQTFSESEAVKIIYNLGKIVSRLHNSNPSIVHRDIKPSNIIMTNDGLIKLIDMNAAKYCRNNASQDTALLGTVGYAAPEQYGFGTSGVQADIYSIGVVLNELLTGVYPREKLAPGYLGEIVRKCTMMDPKDRYLNIEQLLKDLNPDCDEKNEKTAAVTGKYRKYFLPGFRTGNPMNMAIAILGYSMITAMGILLNIQPAKSGAMEILEKFTVVVCGLATVFFSCNYLDVWSIVKIDRIKNSFFKAMAVVAADIVLVTGIIVVMVIMESGMT